MTRKPPSRRVERGSTPLKPTAKGVRVGLAALALIGIAGLLLFLRSRNRTLPPFPPIASQPAASPTWGDFSGAGSCRECHPSQYAAWSASTHGRAGGAPVNDLLLRSFDGRPIRFADATVTPSTAPDGTRSFVVRWNGRPEQRFVIEGVVGGGHMVGGGTQGYLTRYDDGTLRFMPFEVIRRENTWFCNTNTRLDRGWLPITDSTRLTDCGDWPPIRVFGNLPRFANCQECHGSQIEVSPEPQKPAATRLKSLSIDCEACHGPGRPHIEAVRAGTTSPDIGMPALDTLSKQASVAVCMRCHALKDGLRRGWLAGRNFDEYYSVMLPLLSDEDIFPDGRIRTFAYQQGHLWSDCYVSGSMTCVDCHDPHSQTYRDADYRPISSRFDDGQCTSCHPSKAVDPTSHTHHAPDSDGSRCVSCHMPYLQEPEVGSTLRYARSDHTIPVPRPAGDSALGIRNACQTCHVDRDADSLEKQAVEWWGTLKPRPAAVDALLRVSAGDPRALDAALDADSAGTHEPARVIALGKLLTERLLPDMTDLDDATVRRLQAAARSDDPDVAALGLAGLHLTLGNRAATRRQLIEVIRNLGARERAVRLRWSLILGSIADNLRLEGRNADAIAVYDKALEIDSANAGTLLNRGLAHAAAGNTAAAETDYRLSLTIDSLNTLTWVNLGIARAAAGDAGGAISAYQAASRIDPRDPLPWFNLGNLYLRADRPADAVDAYTRAVRFGPGLAPAHFNLGRALILTNRLQEARTALRDGLAFDPGNQPARQAVAQIDSVLRQSGPR